MLRFNHGLYVDHRSSIDCLDWTDTHTGGSLIPESAEFGHPPYVGSGRRHGLCLGLHCSYCCVGLTAILLVIGVMDLRAMAVVTAAITIERV